MSTGNSLSIYTRKYVALFGVGGASTAVVVKHSLQRGYSHQEEQEVREIDAAPAVMIIAVV
ncbi:hypothetical protein PQR63_13030 [Herbaspirillum rhizosphaerae]|uniref:Uncharacterized protein n=1 Tax=Herbaspirillum rhizosphaerae TaxID=346179 RepID=A0ABW8ZBS1_9BURK